MAKVKECVSLMESYPSDGCYEGKWSGFTVVADIDGTRYQMKTDIGVKGIDVPCDILVEYGEIYIGAK